MLCSQTHSVGAGSIAPLDGPHGCFVGGTNCAIDLESFTYRFLQQVQLTNMLQEHVKNMVAEAGKPDDTEVTKALEKAIAVLVCL